MQDQERLLSAFKEGSLLRPSSDVPNIVDLAHAVAWLAGVEGIRRTPGAMALKGLIGSPEHTVFVLADGFGMNFVETLDSGAFIRRNLVAELRTVFPSTTPAVLTSLATGLWPNQHAVTGWETYLPELGAVSIIIKFVRRSDELSLLALGITPQQAYPLPSRLGKASCDILSLVPEDIAHTPYSAYWTGGTPSEGYKELGEAVDRLARRVRGAASPTFTYLYAPQVDMAAHRWGTTHPRTQALVESLDTEMERLASALPANARLIVTADHGLMDVPEEQVHQILENDVLVGCLKRHASGDKRVRYFDVREDAMDDFRRAFRDRFGEGFALISTEEAERLSLFGPGPLSPLARGRLGNLVAISMGGGLLGYAPDTRPPEHATRAAHGGLTPAEMRVPLVIV